MWKTLTLKTAQFFALLFAFTGLSGYAQSPTIGINLTSDNFFADAMLNASPNWDSPTNFGDGSATVDANGWPTEDASIMLWAGRANNEGTYTIIFNGKATLSASFGYANITPQNPDGTSGNYSQSSNTTTATMVVAPGTQNFSLIFTNTQRGGSGGAGVTNVHVYRPIGNGGTSSYPAGTFFTNDVKNVAAKFQLMRFMDLGNTNNSTEVNWTDRKLPGNRNQNQPISWEYMVALSNQTGADLYINIPALATNAYITNLANLIAYGSDGVNPYTSTQANPVYAPLNSARNVYIEYSNETWNFYTTSTIELENRVKSDIVAHNSELATINFDNLDTTGPDSNGNYNNQYILMWRLTAERIKETSDIFRSVFGNSAMPPNANPRIRPILEYQYDNDQQTAYNELFYLDNLYDNGDSIAHQSTPHPVNYFLWGAGGASYFGSNNDDASSVDAIFASGIPYSSFPTTVEGEAVWGKSFGLKTIAYEGGWSVQASNSPNGYDNADGSPAEESKYDPRAATAEYNSEVRFSQNGGDVNVFYTASSFDADYIWGMTDNIEDLTVPIYQGIDQIDSGSQAATTAGTAIPGTVPAGAYHGSTDPTSTEVDFVRNGWNNNYVIEAPSNGTYSLSINFDSGNSATNVVRVLVDGVAYYPNFTGIGYGDSSAVSTPAVSVHLNAGFNGILISAVSADLNLHYLTIGSGGGSGPSQTSTPTFSPAGGTYTSAQSVSLSDSTSGATIYYTTDGSTPTTSSATYSGPIAVSSTETIQAIATASGYTTSAVASATYTINSGTGGGGSEAPYNGPHNIPGTFQASDYDTGGQGVGYNQGVNGGQTGYRTDNNSAIEANSGDNNTGANGYDLGWTSTGQWTKYTVNVATAGTYTVTFSVASPSGQTDAFHLQNAAGTNLSGNINVPNTGAWQVWQTVTASVTLPAGTQVLELAQDNPNWNIEFVTFSSTSQPATATPTFSPAGGTYTSSQSVSISDSTSGATIYYTTNGSTPTTSSTVYSGPIAVSSTETIEAIATASGHTTSAVASATYTINSSSGGGGGGSNVATTGTGYRWAGLSSSTANTGSVAATGVNDGNTTATFALNNGNDDAANAWEAAGVTWSSTQSGVNKVVFYQGTTDTDPNYGNGWFQAGFALQISTDGSTWTNASGWTLSPAYTSGPGASGVAYTFTTTSAVSVKGVRVVGQVHTGGSGSYDAYAAELQVFTGGSSSSQTQVSLASVANLPGLYTDGTTFSSGLDGQGYAYSATLLGSSLTIGSTKFNFGASNANDVVSGSNGPTIALTAGNFSTLTLLGTAINGNQQSQIFTVKYTDGTSTQFTQNVSDWFTPQSYSGESIAKQMAYRDEYNGTKDSRTFDLYQYSFAINNQKTVASVTLPNNSNVILVADTLLP